MSDVRSAEPAVLTLSSEDLNEALAQGWRDFKAAMPYSMFFGAIYAIAGIVIATLLFATHLQFAAYPLVTGFALIAPFAAAGTYEISRRLERGEPLSWRNVLTFRRGLQELGWMALVTTFALVIWLDVALFLYLIFFGAKVLSIEELVTAIHATSSGMLFFVIGNLVGGCIAFFLFAITAVSCPMLVDREVDAITAIITSVRAVRANPKQMIAWAALIGFLLAATTAAFFVGLVFVLPLLGHTTWHLYRKVVAAPSPEGQQAGEQTPRAWPHAA